jgi:myo-inositol-1(or 4)-monophosphatase
MDTDALLALAADAARTGGKVLLDRYQRPSGVDTKSASGDFVSDADRASEQAVTDLLSAARPGDGLLGEEGADRDAPSGVRWVIDPLDGTSNYLYRFGAWTVSIAAQQQGGDGWRTVVGAVYEPLSGDLFTAVAGEGARLGETRLRVNDPVPLEQALLGTGFAYDPESAPGKAR